MYSVLLANGDDLDTSIFTFSTYPPTIAAYTTDISNIGSYDMVLTGQLDSETIETVAFTVTIYSKCHG
jgi:hypothetical protein